MRGQEKTFKIEHVCGAQKAAPNPKKKKILV